MAIDGDKIRKRCEYTVRPMKNEFDSIKGGLLEIARNFDPVGKRALTEEVDQMAHRAESFKEDNILSTVPLEVLEKGAAGFLVNLMNPGQKWLHLEPNDSVGDIVDIANGSGSRSEVIEALERMTLDVIDKEGGYVAAKTMFKDLLAYGFACVIVKPDKERICVPQCLPVGTYSFGVDGDGRVIRVERRFAMTAEELIREFGGSSKGRNALPPDVIEAWKRGENSDSGNFVVRNLIEPNEETYEVGSDDVLSYGLSKRFKYRSIFWLQGRTSTGRVWRDIAGKSQYSGVISVRGFEYNPIVAPRLGCEIGGIYGRGKGHDALNAARGLQACMYDMLEISSNRAEPPLIASNDLRDEGLGTGRGDITYANIGEQRSSMVVPVLPNPPTSDETKQAYQLFEQMLKSTFYVGVFQTIDSLKNVNAADKRTAAEVNALKSENLMLLGGTVLMLDHEAIDPFVMNVVNNILASDKWKMLVGDVGLSTDALVPKYISSLHIAQRTQEVNSMDASVQCAFMLAQSQIPEAAECVKRIDFNNYFRKRHKLIGANESMLFLEDDVQERIMQEKVQQQQAMEAQAQQQQMEAMLTGAKAAAQGARAQEAEINAHMVGGNLPATFGGYPQ